MFPVLVISVIGTGLAAHPATARKPIIFHMVAAPTSVEATAPQQPQPRWMPSANFVNPTRNLFAKLVRLPPPPASLKVVVPR